MNQVKNNVTQLIGNTPIMRLERLEKEWNIPGKLYGKLEYLNPTGSVKDRIALAMIEDAEEKGLLKEGGTIIEPTSGNTGIGLASMAAAKGYKAILTLPETMSIERRNLLKAYGATLVLTDGTKGMKGAIERASELQAEIPNSIILGQFTNEANAQIHYKTTGPEIWRDLEGKVDVLIAGVGTGGTITGVGRYLKEQNPKLQVLAVEPQDSPVLSGGAPGPHAIQGIGAGFIPEVLEVEILDGIIKVAKEDAFRMGQLLATREGILGGISSGAALYAATQVANKMGNAELNVVVILPDSGDRYLSTPMFSEEA
ncbi:MAG: cysteine synthase A [Eubacteriales bacterium]